MRWGVGSGRSPVEGGSGGPVLRMPPTAAAPAAAAAATWDGVATAGSSDGAAAAAAAARVLPLDAPAAVDCGTTPPAGAAELRCAPPAAVDARVMTRLTGC